MSNAAFIVAGRDADRVIHLLSNGLLTEDDKRLVERLKNSSITRSDIADLRMPAHINHRCAQDRLRVAVDLAHQNA